MCFLSDMEVDLQVDRSEEKASHSRLAETIILFLEVIATYLMGLKCTERAIRRCF